MDGIEKFIEEFNWRYGEFGDVEYYSDRFEECDAEEIDASLQSVRDTFKCCRIPVEEDSSKADPKCVKAFKVLLFNTQLTCLNDLARDPKNVPFVATNDSKMTPYFLMEVVSCLEYEQILAESLIHIPLDLCIEILEIVKNNIYLWDFERGFDLVIAIISNCYKNLIFACKNGTQSRHLETNLEILMISVQEFMALLSSPKFLRLSEVGQLQKSERTGTILKKIIALTIKCLSGSDNDSLSPEIVDDYRLMFSDVPIQRSEENFAPQLRMLNQEFMHILMRKLEDINTECYDNWADLDANGNSSVSLQRSIRKDLYNFTEFLKVYKDFMYYKRLMELLQKFKPEPVDIVSALNLDGLRYGSIEIKIESLKSVIHRYSEWDHDTFDLIKQNRILLDDEDIPYLIDYLALIMRRPCQEYHKRLVFVTIRKALFKQQTLDDWPNEPMDGSDSEFNETQEIESNESRKIEFNDSFGSINSDDLECLDSEHSEDNFKSFIARNEDLKSRKNLRTTLSYLLNNPRYVLRILIEVIIGVPGYANLSISPEDLVFFHPVVKLGGSEMRLLLSEIRNVVMLCEKWDANKFADLINLMLNEFKFTANDFVKDVLASWIYKKPTDLSVFVLMLKFIQDSIIEKCTMELNILRLAQGFAHRLTDCRRDRLLPRSVSSVILGEIILTATPFFSAFGNNIRGDIPMDNLEPIDRFKLPFVILSTTLHYTGVFGSSIVGDLKYECLLGIERARQRVNGNIPINPDAPTHCRDLKHLKNDFLRYILIKCSEIEMMALAVGFGDLMEYDSNNKLKSIDAILQRCIETAIYFLEFPDHNPPESFACSMRGLARCIGKALTEALVQFRMGWSPPGFRRNTIRLRKIYGCWRYVKNNLRVLAKTVRHSTFYPLYETLMATVDDSSLRDDPRGVALFKIRSALEKFGNDCMKIAHSEVRFDRPPSAKALRFKRGHDFINECLNVGHHRIDDASQYHSLCATLKQLRTQE